LALCPRWRSSRSRAALHGYLLGKSKFNHAWLHGPTPKPTGGTHLASTDNRPFMDARIIVRKATARTRQRRLLTKSDLSVMFTPQKDGTFRLPNAKAFAQIKPALRIECALCNDNAAYPSLEAFKKHYKRHPVGQPAALVPEEDEEDNGAGEEDAIGGEEEDKEGGNGDDDEAEQVDWDAEKEKGQYNSTTRNLLQDLIKRPSEIPLGTLRLHMCRRELRCVRCLRFHGRGCWVVDAFGERYVGCRSRQGFPCVLGILRLHKRIQVRKGHPVWTLSKGKNEPEQCHCWRWSRVGGMR
ncbi:hypothetical protein OC834_006828, partial [Tilletia horrida]